MDLSENEIEAHWERSFDSCICWSQISNWHGDSWPSWYWYYILAF